MGKSGYHRYENRVSWAFALLPLGAAGAAFILPYASALAGGILREGAALPGETLLPVLAFTVRQAGLSTLTALALGLPGAWLLGTGRFRGAALIRALTGIPFAMPPILVVLGFVLFFGNSGWINRFFMAATGREEGPLRLLYRPAAIILAHGFYNFPLVIRLVGDGLSQTKNTYGAAAASLGASGLKTALTILLPLSLPAVAAASLLTFLYSFTSFSVVLVLGGGPKATTLAVEIYRYARISLDYHRAGLLALVETLIAGSAFLAFLFFERRGRALTAGTELRYRVMEKQNRSLPARLGITLYGLVTAFFVLGPLISVPVESFLYKPSRAAPRGFSLHWWRSLETAGTVFPALGRSLILAVLSATLASLLAVLAAAAVKTAEKPLPERSGFLGTLVRIGVTAPLSSSGIVLSLGWLMLYGRDHARSLWAVVLIHGVIALPFAFNSLSQGFNGLPENLLHAASVFGGGPVKRILTVALPLFFRRIRSAWAFSAVLSLGELNAVLMLGMEEWETLPLLIYRAAGAYRYGTACAGGALLILCCAGALLLSEAGSGRNGHGA
ncbi:iron ABC transporter permease [Treponema sp. TIM-1]|uniref:ABC transporter permease n=1 Tax=Treponema sp. TIM-1 TaxID=2898417 RepID=UPI0039809CFE